MPVQTMPAQNMLVQAMPVQVMLARSMPARDILTRTTPFQHSPAQTHCRRSTQATVQLPCNVYFYKGLLNVTRSHIITFNAFQRSKLLYTGSIFFCSSFVINLAVKFRLVVGWGLCARVGWGINRYMWFVTTDWQAPAGRMIPPAPI